MVILCGGQGTRLREETEAKPKPMVEIGGDPILWHIMKIYGHHGLRRFVLCLGYLGIKIKEYFLAYNERRRDFTVDMSGHRPLAYLNDRGNEDWLVTCAETGADSGTGGRVRLVQKYVTSDTFLLTYGDCVGNVDIDALLDFHYAQGRIGTVTGVHPAGRYGEMTVADGRALEFNEKPTVTAGVINGGFFVFEREFFDYLGDDPTHFLEYAPLRNLARDGELSVYVHEGFWHPMDTYRDNLHLNKLWSAGDAAWKVWKDPAGGT